MPAGLPTVCLVTTSRIVPLRVISCAASYMGLTACPGWGSDAARAPSGITMVANNAPASSRATSPENPGVGKCLMESLLVFGGKQSNFTKSECKLDIAEMIPGNNLSVAGADLGQAKTG